MTNETSRDTPPRQVDDATAADRRLGNAQKGMPEGEPAPPDSRNGVDLPDPKEVGEAG